MKTQKSHLHPVYFVIVSIINKIFQHPEIYPIKYYRKVDKIRKGRKNLY